MRFFFAEAHVLTCISIVFNVFPVIVFPDNLHSSFSAHLIIGRNNGGLLGWIILTGFDGFDYPNYPQFLCSTFNEVTDVKNEVVAPT